MPPQTWASTEMVGRFPGYPRTLRIWILYKGDLHQVIKAPQLAPLSAASQRAMGRTRRRSGNEIVVAQLNTQERWEQLVDATSYGHLPRLGVVMKIRQPDSVTKFWNVSQWRLILKGKTGSAVTSFDYDAWEQWLRDQAEVERKRQERLQAERDEQEHLDAVRLGRLAELTAKVTAKRKHIWAIEHRFAGKAEILDKLKRELAHWELIKDVPLCLAEIGWCWESGKLWNYTRASPPHPTPPHPAPSLPIPTPSSSPPHPISPIPYPISHPIPSCALPIPTPPHPIPYPIPYSSRVHLRRHARPAQCALGAGASPRTSRAATRRPRQHQVAQQLAACAQAAPREALPPRGAALRDGGEGARRPPSRPPSRMPSRSPSRLLVPTSPLSGVPARGPARRTSPTSTSRASPAPSTTTASKLLR